MAIAPSPVGVRAPAAAPAPAPAAPGFFASLAAKAKALQAPAPLSTPWYSPAPAAAPAPLVNPAYQPYIDQFTKSLDASRAAVTAQLAQAQQSLGQRRDAAAQVVAAIPASTAAGYQDATNQQNAATQFAQSQLSPDVAARVQAQGAPLQQALAQNKGGADSSIPFAQLANEAQYGGGLAAIQQAGADQNAQLDTEGRSMQTSLLQNQMQEQQQQEQNAFTMQQTAAQNAAQLEAQKQTAKLNATTQQQQQLAATGYQNATPQTVNKVKQDPAYLRMEQLEEKGIRTPAANGDLTAKQKLAISVGADRPTTTQRPTGAQVLATLRMAGKNDAWIESVASLHPEWGIPIASVKAAELAAKASSKKK